MSVSIQGQWAVVTGASSGIGQDLARELAAQGANLILAARRVEPMELLAGELRDRHRVQVESIGVDLLKAEDRIRLFEQAHSNGRTVTALVNNAGFGLHGDFLARTWEETERLIDLDMKALTHLSHLFGTEMAKKGMGCLLQVGSTGSFQPSPSYAVYSAAKAYVLSFSQAIDYELKPRGVSSTALCPGVTKSEFLLVSGQKATFYQRMTMMESNVVARIGINAMLKRKSMVVPGFVNKFGVFANRITPRFLIVKIAALMMK